MTVTLLSVAPELTQAEHLELTDGEDDLPPSPETLETTRLAADALSYSALGDFSRFGRRRLLVHDPPSQAHERARREPAPHGRPHHAPPAPGRAARAVRARVIELESIKMVRDYRLEARSDTPESAVRRIFEPSFIEWCVDERNVLFELEDRELIVAVRYHIFDNAALEDLWARASWVAKRITEASENHQTQPRHR